MGQGGASKKELGMWEGGTAASVWGRGCHHPPLLFRMECHGQLTRSRPKAWDRTISCSNFFLMYSAESTMPWGGGEQSRAVGKPLGPEQPAPLLSLHKQAVRAGGYFVGSIFNCIFQMGKQGFRGISA